MQIYVVQPGDSVNSIASLYGIPSPSIIYNNQIPWPYSLAVGQSLLLSTGPGSEDRSFIRSGGYAYPYISPWVLSRTLPYLTELYVFSYGFTSEGFLIPPALDDTWMTEAARQAGTLPILTLTPLGPYGLFNNTLIHTLVQTPAVRERLLLQLVQVMEEKGYAGLDIDFEYILAEDREAFSDFVRAAADAIHPYGYRLSVALAPKTSPFQAGGPYEGQDYAAIGAAADQVLLMTYEWGYTYGPNMAVAPLNKVREVAEYAVSEIPPEKICLGFPNYGYDWALPFVRGVTAAVTIGNVEAVTIAVSRGSSIQFDEPAASPFFRYTDSGITHEVWFEDVRSLQAKFSLVEEFGLAGTGCWQIMRWFLACWLLLSDRFWIQKHQPEIPEEPGS